MNINLEIHFGPNSKSPKFAKNRNGTTEKSITDGIHKKGNKSE